MNRKIQKVYVSRSFLLTLALGASLLLAVPTPVVHAATINVDSLNGIKYSDTLCTLPEAIENANNDAATWPECEAGSGDDTIVISIPDPKVIELLDADNGGGTLEANGLPMIASNITINGNGATIQRSYSPVTPAFRIFSVAYTATLTLNNVMIKNGKTKDDGTMSGPGGHGGGIMSWGTLVVNNSKIFLNRTGGGRTGGYGGGIMSLGTLTITNSSISSNITGPGGNAGGHGGGIFSFGQLSISNSMVAGNMTGNGTGVGGFGGLGGGIYIIPNSTLSLTNTSVVSNRTGNGITYGGDGGGIHNSWNVTTTIANSTISSNTTGTGGTSGGVGGGIYKEDGTLTITSSTIASNTAAGNGGGIKSSSGTATVKNSIVANNTAAAGPNCVGTITNGGNNLDNGTSCGWGSANGSMSSTDPQLDALIYSGVTYRHALLLGSPAIDGVTWSPPNGSPVTDQRGVARPQGARHDIGAYEAVIITVNDPSGGTGSPGCKLRDAITAANTYTATGGCPAGFAPNIIVLPTGATITLSEVDNHTAFSTNGLPVISENVAIDGNGATIERSSASETPAFRLFEVGVGRNLTLNNVTLSNGRAPDAPFVTWPGQSGGAISSGGRLVVNNSTISGSRAGSSVNGPGGDGGGIYASGTLIVTNTTISGNTTGSGSPDGDGGGIYASGGLTLTNSTLTANTAYGEGGGLVVDGGGGVTSSTIANNTAAQGGGVRAEVTLRNTIVANNTAPIGENCYGPTPNGGNNLDSGTSCGWGATNGSLSSTNPLLGPLGYYGGPTQTMPLASNSPARDGITWTPPNGSPSTDQRGFGRPYGVRHDIGAFEWHPPVYLPLLRR